MKKTLSIFLAVVLLLSVVGSTVSAETTAVSSTLSYEKAPDALIDMFEEAGCDVPISAEFSLVPAVSTTGRNVSSIEDMALCMTTVNGSTVSKTILLSVGVDEDDTLVVDNEPTYLLRAQPRFSYPVTLRNKVRIVGTANYNATYQNTYTYCQPVSCSFSYGRTAAGASSNVIYAGVKYYIEGYRLYNGTFGTHTINCTSSSPIEGRTYSNTGNPASDYYMIGNGTHVMDYECSVDGAYERFTVGVTS
ncbi:hypothetical protein [Hominenteromicrobium sp.]|mgnify:CR=1 FL=1|nr:hypothetical protein [Acutalibacteraceae bacterium]